MFKKKFLLNFPAGIAVGSIISLILAALIANDVQNQLAKFYVYIFSAGVTLLAATLALAGVLANINTQMAVSESNRQRRLFAAKAKLNLALANFSQTCAFYIREIERRKRNNPPQSSIANNTVLSEDSISTIIDVIRNCETEDGKILSTLITDYQIASSRWKHCTGIDAEANADQCEIKFAEIQVEWAYIYCRVANCFAYARGSEHIIDDANDCRIQSALIEIERQIDVSVDHQRAINAILMKNHNELR